jgi:hypothetical protein
MSRSPAWRYCDDQLGELIPLLTRIGTDASASLERAPSVLKGQIVSRSSPLSGSLRKAARMGHRRDWQWGRRRQYRRVGLGEDDWRRRY